MLRRWNFEIQLDERSDKAVYLQIADAIIKDIHSGRLKAGDALPGSRNLAQLLNQPEYSCGSSERTDY